MMLAGRGLHRGHARRAVTVVRHAGHVDETGRRSRRSGRCRRRPGATRRARCRRRRPRARPSARAPRRPRTSRGRTRSTSSSVPLRAVPMAVRQAETMTASPMEVSLRDRGEPGIVTIPGSDGKTRPIRARRPIRTREPGPVASRGVSGDVVVIDELFDAAGAAAMVELCERFGAYRMYAELEQLDTDIGRGLSQRHDSVVNFIRTGGRLGQRRAAARARGAHELLPRGVRVRRPACASTASSRSCTTRRSSRRPRQVHGRAGDRARDRVREPHGAGPGARGAHRRARVPRLQPQGSCRSGCSS